MSSAHHAWILGSLAAFAAFPTAAFDYVVTRYDDPAPDGCLADDCSLREAVIAANAALPLDRILLSAGRYELTIANEAGDEDFAATGDLDLTSNLEIVGPGATMTTIDANGLDRVLQAYEIDSLDNPTVAIRGVTFTGGGDASGSVLFVRRIPVTIEECELVDNGADGGDESVLVFLFGSVTIRRSTLAGNLGMAVRASQATATLENVTTSGNGGHELQADTAGTVHCKQCTLFGTEDGPELVANGAGSVVHVSNSILVGTCAAAAGGVVTSLNGNVESGSITCGWVESQDVMNASVASLHFAALGDAGGATRVFLPDTNSIANGNALDANCLPTDQRSVERTTDCESGSVEIAPRPATPIFADGFLQGDPDAWSVP